MIPRHYRWNILPLVINNTGYSNEHRRQCLALDEARVEEHFMIASPRLTGVHF